MQDDVKAVELELRAAADEMRAAGHSGWPVLCDVTADTLAALQQRCERLEQAARAALPWVTGEEEATALEAALEANKNAPHSIGMQGEG